MLREQRTAERKQRSAAPVSKQPEIADSGEPAGKHMLEEAPQKLLMRERHRSALAVMCVVFPPERDLGIVHVDDPMVRDCDAVSVTGQVM